jgi:hypothetical protein
METIQISREDLERLVSVWFGHELPKDTKKIREKRTKSMTSHLWGNLAMIDVARR